MREMTLRTVVKVATPLAIVALSVLDARRLRCPRGHAPRPRRRRRPRRPIRWPTSAQNVRLVG